MATPTEPAKSRRIPSGEPGTLTDIDKLLRLMSKYEASDLHLKVGNPPIMRVKGKIRFFDAEDMNGEVLENMLQGILTPGQRATFAAGKDLDFAYSIPKVGRYRVNAYRQRGSVSLAIRRVSTDIPSFQELHLKASAMERFASMRQGLVIVTGVTGSGKSTTLASMIETINTTRRCHIITIEDPIEYLYRDKKAFVNQREVGIDVPSFHDALKSVVRQDPDVILIGEMRDRETFETALTAAETGHLVFGTLHSSTVSQTVGRIIDMFPADRERALRQALAFSLRGIVCQKILPSIKEGVGLVPVQEILICTPTVQKLIMDGEDKQLESIVRGGREDGMQDFNRGLMDLVAEGLISEKVALEASHNAEQLTMNLKGIFLGDDRKGIVK
ncbi:MAG: PilT/PilU family type 4a pilus ATPase [Planctomycetes bacterium]|nr:PilT/PilU family type 4a pilus ATPase [Planctomycetota bacterium]